MFSFLHSWSTLIDAVRTFDPRYGRYFLDQTPDYPVYAVLLYLAAVFWLPRHISKPFPLHYLVAAWNFAFSLFSLVGTYYVVPMVWRMLQHVGFHHTACVSIPLHMEIAAVPPPYELRTQKNHSKNVEFVLHLLQGPPALFLVLFVYAKTPELCDTLFLVLQKKPVSFLHWYHHLVTAVFCWHAAYVCVPSGVFFAAMNYTVHAVMYFYFGLVALGWRAWIRPFAPFITTLQVLQMFAGMGITVFTWLQYHLGPQQEGTWFYLGMESLLRAVHYILGRSFRMEEYFGGCCTDPTNIRMGMIMYGSYCILFAVLFKELYIDPPKRKRRGRSTEANEKERVVSAQVGRHSVTAG